MDGYQRHRGLLATGEHRSIATLREQLTANRLSRREFIRLATLLGMAAPAAYSQSGTTAPVQANTSDLPRGGALRLAAQVLDVRSPHTYSWVAAANIGRGVHEYLTKTGADDVTRPQLIERWAASEDFRSWELQIRRVNWRSGRALTADDIIWNLRRCLDPTIGSSTLGLMKDYLLEEFDTGQRQSDGSAVISTRLWDANAIEKIDDHALRLNLRKAQIALPEHLFHYPLAILDPEEHGVFGVGANGTGPFELVEFEIGKLAVLKARTDYWGNGPYLDEVRYVDLGDDLPAKIRGIVAAGIDGLDQIDIDQLDVFRALPNVQVYLTQSANTAVARMQVDRPEFRDVRVRQALRLAVDSQQVLELSHQNHGLAGEHHHVCPINQDYLQLPIIVRDVKEAKRLLDEAGYTTGIDLTITGRKESTWEARALDVLVQQWSEAGIRVTVSLLPAAQFREVWNQVPFGFTSWSHRPLGTMMLALAYRSDATWNESHFASVAFDDLLSKAEGTIDVSERRKLVGKLQRLLQLEGPIVQPLWRTVCTPMSKRVRGFTMHPSLYIFAEELALES